MDIHSSLQQLANTLEKSAVLTQMATGNMYDDVKKYIKERQDAIKKEVQVWLSNDTDNTYKKDPKKVLIAMQQMGMSTTAYSGKVIDVCGSLSDLLCNVFLYDEKNKIPYSGYSNDPYFFKGQYAINSAIYAVKSYLKIISGGDDEKKDDAGGKLNFFCSRAYAHP